MLLARVPVASSSSGAAPPVCAASSGGGAGFASRIRSASATDGAPAYIERGTICCARRRCSSAAMAAAKWRVMSRMGAAEAAKARSVAAASGTARSWSSA